MTSGNNREKGSQASDDLGIQAGPHNIVKTIGKVDFLSRLIVYIPISTVGFYSPENLYCTVTGS